MSNGFHHSQTSTGIPTQASYARGCRCSACSALHTDAQRAWRRSKGIGPRTPKAEPEPVQPHIDPRIKNIDAAIQYAIEQRDRCARLAQWWADQARARHRDVMALTEAKDDLLADEVS